VLVPITSYTPLTTPLDSFDDLLALIGCILESKIVMVEGLKTSGDGQYSYTVQEWYVRGKHVRYQTVRRMMIMSKRWGRTKAGLYMPGYARTQGNA
jgi:hypothetical protein